MGSVESHIAAFALGAVFIKVAPTFINRHLSGKKADKLNADLREDPEMRWTGQWISREPRQIKNKIK